MVVNGELPPETVEPAPEPELGAAAAPKMPKRERGKKADKPVSNRTPKPGKCAELIAAIKAAVPETARADRMVAAYATRVYLSHRQGESSPSLLSKLGARKQKASRQNAPTGASMFLRSR
jgi:hypothetical protein